MFCFAKIKPTKFVGFYMKISKKSQYGLRAMVYLASLCLKKKPCPLKEVSKVEGIPFDFLEKIFSELQQEGLIKSRKEARGGYFLAKSPRKISVREILVVLENKLADLIKN